MGNLNDTVATVRGRIPYEPIMQRGVVMWTGEEILDWYVSQTAAG